MASQSGTVYKGDRITYSGYDGDGTNPGNEFIEFSDATNQGYTMNAFGFSSGYAQVTYPWTGQVGCKNESMDPKGSGFFVQNIARGSSVIVGDLPQGLEDIFIRLENTDDIDIQLYDESTPIIDWNDGIVIRGERSFSIGQYAGVEIQYSGYHGEQRPGTYGQEYIFLRGRLEESVFRIYFWSGASDVSMGLLYRSKEFHWEQCVSDSTPPYHRRSHSSSQDDESGSDKWNREHVWPKSHGNFGTRRGAGTDLHALRASDSSINADRGSKDFDTGGVTLDGDGSVIDCPACLERSNSFEPPDDVKGSVARMVLYMSIRYNGDSDSNGLTLHAVDSIGTSYGSATTGHGQLGKLSNLKDWHTKNPPSNEEKLRNNLIFSIQGNRNPLIDNPEWVELLF
eukprot:scaffold5017_cov171-Amphora_coffeaeformis.AAC.18